MPAQVACSSAIHSSGFALLVLIEQVGQSQLRGAVGVTMSIGWRGGLQQARRAYDLVGVSLVITQLRIDGLCIRCV